MNNDFRRDILKKRAYWICLILILCLSYLFDMTNRTVSVDDLARQLYVGDGQVMLKSTRWGVTLWTALLTSSDYSPFIDKFLAVFFFIVGSVMFSRLFYIYFSQNEYKLALCTLFSCLYVSFPLIHEIWNYNFASFIIAADHAIAALCILMLYHNKKIFSKVTIICSLLLSIVVSSDEGTAFVYVTVVLSILLLDCIIFHKRNWIVSGIHFAIPLILAVFLKYLIGIGIIHLLNLEFQVNGATEIYWKFNNGLRQQIKSLVQTTLITYFAKGFVYLPIGIFIAALGISFVSVCVVFFKQKDYIVLLIYPLLLGSLFFQSIIQGVYMPYRTAQTIQYFCAFTITMFIFGITYFNKRKLLSVCFVCAGFLCFRQAAFLNKVLALNNQRSDNEAAIVYNIGYRLQTEFDDKTIFFAGMHDLGDNITRQMIADKNSVGAKLFNKYLDHLGLANDRPIGLFETDILSVINWGILAFQSQTMLAEIFSYYGFDIQTKDHITYDEFLMYSHLAEDMNMHPLDIRDVGDVILVYMGPYY